MKTITQVVEEAFAAERENPSISAEDIILGYLSDKGPIVDEVAEKLRVVVGFNRRDAARRGCARFVVNAIV